MLGNLTRPNRSTTFALLALIVITSLMLTACQGEATRDVSAIDVQVAIASPTPKPYPFDTSEPGTATIHGMLLVLDPMSMVPAPDDAIYLVPLKDAEMSIPQFVMGEVPQAEVDETIGEFMFTNIQAGSYAVVVVTKGGAQIPSRFYQTGNYAIFTVNPDQMDTVIELGQLSLP